MTDHDFFLSKIQELIDAERARYAEKGYDFTERAAGSHTIGDFIGAVCSIDNGEDALRFFNGHVAHIQAQIDAGKWKSEVNALTGARMNVGWCFGEGMSPDLIRMWSEVTGSAHPMGYTPASTPREMFEAGRKLAAK